MKRMKQSTTLSIKDAAAATGLSIDTLRYYERQGLIIRPQRSTSGHRRYSQADIEWIRFVVRLRTTGFPLADIQRYAAMVRGGSSTLQARHDLLHGYERELAERIRQLETAHAEIRRVLGQYRRALKGAALDICEPLNRRSK